MTGDGAGRTTRRRVLAVTATAAASLGLAGCSSGDGSSDGGGDGGGSSEDGGSSGGGDGADGANGGDGSASSGTDGGSVGTPDGLVSVDVPGELTENTVQGIDVVDHQGYEARDHDSLADGAFSLVVTIENTGSEEVEPLGYTYELDLYDDSDGTINSGYSARSHDYRVSPGGTGQVETWGGSAGMAADVARYEVAVTCDGSFADGVYCE